jgi:hypothetical protein
VKFLLRWTFPSNYKAFMKVTSPKNQKYHIQDNTTKRMYVPATGENFSQWGWTCPLWDGGSAHAICSHVARYNLRVVLVRYSQLVFEILANLDGSKMRESRKQVENNAQVLSSIYRIFKSECYHYDKINFKFTFCFEFDWLQVELYFLSVFHASLIITL